MCFESSNVLHTGMSDSKLPAQAFSPLHHPKKHISSVNQAHVWGVWITLLKTWVSKSKVASLSVNRHTLKLFMRHRQQPSFSKLNPSLLWGVWIPCFRPSPCVREQTGILLNLDLHNFLYFQRKWGEMQGSMLCFSSISYYLAKLAYTAFYVKFAASPRLHRDTHRIGWFVLFIGIDLDSLS